MHTAILSMLAAVATSPPQAPPVRECPPQAPPVRDVVAVIHPTKVAEAKSHTHRCANGHEWSHTHASKGNFADHTCPVCGQQDWTPNQLGVKIVNQPVEYVPTVQNSTCPPGVNCPQNQSTSYRPGLLGRLFR